MTPTQTYRVHFADGTIKDLHVTRIDRINGYIDYLEDGIEKRLDESNVQVANYYRIDNVQERFNAEWLIKSGFAKGEVKQ